ncbi:fibronectin type III domain-containing protein [Blautia sp. MSJ-19]|uniref:fibronectin type III domain-containing protein n=1 Tax=Blautia sp. MSJ-19 TaxID=2841517 RepID=UPI001C0F2966|nr:fibronectin type III domain-containing protein [Blautia sp. MSJ-19]MBU5479671.1 fibronectin type III domain-containing protein [Blautia sp. MSJ-19]
MSKTGRYKRSIALVFILFLMLSAVLVTDTPVHAASSIKTATVKTKIKASSNTALRIEWNKISSAQGYVIYRRESVKKSYTRIKTVKAGTTTYLNRGLTSSKPYQYAVRAYRKENGKYVYSKYVAATGATRPATTTTTAKAASSSKVNVSWKKNTRSDGYRIYRKVVNGSWAVVADVAKTQSSYADAKVSANTKYVYTVRPYKKGGGVKYMSAVKLSNQVTTPKAPAANTSNSNSAGTSVSNSKFTAAQKDVMKKILYAVETGGQVYGKQDYADFTRAYTNSSAEHAITIGAGQWYGTEAQKLLKLIHQTMGDTAWKKYDTSNGLWNDVCNKNWSTYKDTKYQSIIVKIISSDTGKKCQDQLMYEQIAAYESEVRNLGVTDVQAVGMFINIRHQGGYTAVTRVLGKTKKPYNLINVYNALASDYGNQVGTYKTRQAKVYQWLYTYMK